MSTRVVLSAGSAAVAALATVAAGAAARQCGSMSGAAFYGLPGVAIAACVATVALACWRLRPGYRAIVSVLSGLVALPLVYYVVALAWLDACGG